MLLRPRRRRQRGKGELCRQQGSTTATAAASTTTTASRNRGGEGLFPVLDARYRTYSTYHYYTLVIPLTDRPAGRPYRRRRRQQRRNTSRARSLLAMRTLFCLATDLCRPRVQWAAGLLRHHLTRATTFWKQSRPVGKDNAEGSRYMAGQTYPYSVISIGYNSSNRSVWQVRRARRG